MKITTNTYDNISFVETDNLEVINNLEDLEALLKRSNKKIQRVDLSNIDLRNLDFSDFELEDVVFNYFDVTRKERKEIFNVNFKGCIMNRVSFAQCSLCRCNFDSYKKSLNNEKDEITEVERNTSLSQCDFFFSEFVNCRFKNARMSVVDFRYSSFTDCSMGYVHVQYGDFYMTAFHGTTSFSHSVFSLCSITNATFDNHCLLMENIHGLIQEDYACYSQILINRENWSKHNPCADFSELNKAEKAHCELDSRIYIAKEAKHIYTILSGLYSGKGFFRDSNKAYAKAKKCESTYLKLLMQKDKQDKAYRSWVRHWFKRLDPLSVMLIGYGYKVWPVITAFALLIAIYWCMWWYVESQPWNDSLAVSICNSMGPHFSKIDKLDHLLASIETATGILLVGFLGFVIANKIRNNS